MPPDPPEGCGVLICGDALIEPFGPVHFIEMAERFALQARREQAAGFSRLRLEDAPSLALCRAALIGARGSGLPVDITMRLCEDGRSPAGSSPLASLVTLQALGAASFGFSAGSCPQAVREEAARLAPWADIPFFLRPGERMSPAEPVSLDEGSILGACESELFVLEEEFEYSEPVTCELDMSEDILEIENCSNDVLLVRVDTADDAYHFSLNAHMARLPVAFSSDSEEALEMALALFNGRAVIDSLSDVPRPVLCRLAREYGAYVV